MSCSQNLINQAHIICEKKKERLTKPRLEVLKILSKSHEPIGAYEIINQLKDILDSPKPPTIYRAIDFWLQMGFIHRIESLNAYVACHSNHSHLGAQFMICGDCNTVTEVHLDKITQSLQQSLSQTSFLCSRWNLEIHGQCGNCRSNSI